MTTKQFKPKQPVAYSGEGSAIDNYLSGAPGTVSSPNVPVKNFGTFTKSKPNPIKRKVLFSKMYTAKWTKSINGFDQPDLQRLSDFLQSEKLPIRKPLKDMTDTEMEKIITAFRGIVKHTWK